MTASIATRPNRNSFLHVLFTTAVEGGISYWSRCGDYHWRTDRYSGYATAGDDLTGFYAEITPGEDGWGCDQVFQSSAPDADAAGVSAVAGGFLMPLAQDQVLRIDRAVMERGTRMFVRHCHGDIDQNGSELPESQRHPLRDGHYWRQFLVAEATHGCDGDFDADVADIVVQMGLFGQVVYG